MATKDHHPEIFHRIGELTPDGFLMYNVKERSIVYANGSFKRIFDIRDELVLYNDLLKIRTLIIEKDDFVEPCLRQFLQEKRLHNVECRTKNSRFVSIDAYLLDEQLAIAVIKDITDSKEFLNYITEFGARKDALLDMIAHNLSGPLNMTNNLLNAVDQANQAQRYKTIDNYSRLIRENTQQCIDIINSFLREEHLASEKVFVEKNRFDVLEKIRIIIERIKPFNPDKMIQLNSNVAELFISNDDVKFFQIVHNVLSNAIKFTPANGSVIIDVISHEKEFTVSVRDNGIGIPEHLKPYIFSRNTPAGRPGVQGEKSTGLGLYIVKKLVELMKGTITFQSEENRGSTFTIQLPKIIH